MTFGHGRDGNFQLDSSGGSLVDLSPYITNVSGDRSIDMADVTHIGDQDKYSIPGTKGMTLSISALMEPVLVAHVGGIAGLLATQSFSWSPMGVTTGLPLFTGEGRVTRYSPAGGIGGAAGFNFDLMLDGALTLGVN